MNIFKNILTFFLFLCMIIACSQNPASPDLDSTTDISFNISKTNSDNDFTSTVSVFRFKKNYHSWSLKQDGAIDIHKENIYEVTLDNGETIEFGIWFSKQNEDTAYVNYSPDKSWSYKNAEFEKERFFHDFDEARILIGDNVIFYLTENDAFVISDIQKVADKEPKNHISVNFKGRATGFYDPQGIYSPVYTIDEGRFRGILE